MARPTVKTEGNVEKLRYAFSVGATVTEACYYAGIDRKTYYNWKETDPELFHEFEQLRQDPVLKARKVIIDKLNEGDIKTAMWYLEKMRISEGALREERKHNPLESLWG